ncbi:hypothetical protein HC762_01100 [bacterium]|nr:hypothetical protein [bacterium]
MRYHDMIPLLRPDCLTARRTIELHHAALRALAVEDDEFYRLIIHYLPFETSQGTMTLQEYRDAYKVNREIPALQNLLAATSSYVTLDYLSQMVREGQDFTVEDAKEVRTVDLGKRHARCPNQWVLGGCGQSH